MNHYMGFDPHLTRERNEGIRHEVETLRLEKRLRQNGEPRPGARFASLVSKCTLPLLRRAGLAG